jgi:hypothetical protein
MLRFKNLFLALAVAAIGLTMPSCTGDTYVRFTWEASQEHKIDNIAVSHRDVSNWYNNVYLAAYYIEEDASDIPRHSGSRDLPNNFYNNPGNKGRYLWIEPGRYTAVCSVEDAHGFADIVANYRINSDPNGSLRYYEIAFDVRRFLNGTDDWGWYENMEYSGSTPQMLRKVRSEQIVSEDGGTMDVDFYVFRRPQK